MKWKGYSEEDNTWEPISSLKTCKSLLSKFSGNVSEDEQNSKNSEDQKPKKIIKNSKKIKK